MYQEEEPLLNKDIALRHYYELALYTLESREPKSTILPIQELHGVHALHINGITNSYSLPVPALHSQEAPCSLSHSQ
jgi:hypothetical protein